MKHASALLSYLILLASLTMSVWGVLGFIEYFSGYAPLMPLQNQNFPAGTQFIHWVLITASGLTYLFGYWVRWQYTPSAMVVLFACLITMCFIQTFDFMTRPDRYTAFAREAFYYVLISVYLFRSSRMRAHFQRAGDVSSAVSTKP